MEARGGVVAARVRGLSKRYGDHVALDSISLDVAAGELRGLLGPNGAGKTTLLRALFGLIRPDAGRVELFDAPPAENPAPPLRGVAGFVEEPAFYPYLSGRANLELLAELDDASAHGRRRNVTEALDRVGLSGREGDRVGGYSTGMRQRLGIAAALLREPRLLILDEPTSGLDPAGARTVSALLRELAADGVAVLLSSHLIGELESICDAYTIIRGGRVVWDGSAQRLAGEAPPSLYALSTADDERALATAARLPDAEVEAVPGRAGLRVHAQAPVLDALVLALARDGVAVRRLELLASPLESMFFSLTQETPRSSP